MKLTRDNYELWFLDYTEGKLSQTQIEELRHFLQSNEDLAEELEAIAPVLRADLQLTYPGKEKLKKSLFEDQEYLETSIIASLEGDLTGAEQLLLEKWIAYHPAQNELVRSFGLVKLKPDQNIGFPLKAQLKRKSILRLDWRWMTSIAALLLLALIVLQPGNRKNEPITASRVALAGPQKGNREIEPATASKIPRSTSETKIRTETPAVVSQLHPHGAPKRNPLPKSPEKRSFDGVTVLLPRYGMVKSDLLLFADLVPIRERESGFPVSCEILLSDFLKKKYDELKADEPKVLITREEIVIAGLHLFSRLPGHRLTGKKGADGNLKSISFNSQLLAFSIPLNR